MRHLVALLIFLHGYSIDHSPRTITALSTRIAVVLLVACSTSTSAPLSLIYILSSRESS